MHGSAVQQSIAARTGGAVQVDNSTLYRSLHRMLERGLVSDYGEHSEAALDERRRLYRITPLGREVARAEVARLAQLIGLAREKGLASSLGRP